MLCWHIMKFGIYMWTGRACVKLFFEIQNLVSQVRCVSLGPLLWTMCILVFFYCGGRSNGLITRKLGFKNLEFLSSHLERSSAILSLFLSLIELPVVEKSLTSVFAFLFLSSPNMLSKGIFFVCGNQNGLTKAPRNHLIILNDSSGDPLKKIFI